MHIEGDGVVEGCMVNVPTCSALDISKVGTYVKLYS